MSTSHSAPQDEQYPYPSTAEGKPSTALPPYPGSVQRPGGRAEGERFKNQSLLFGVLALFVAGLVLAPFAIYYARKAEELEVPATAGKVLGWVTVVIYAIYAALFQTLIYFLILASLTGYGDGAI
ncbi:hypothetical protein N2K95_15200 [Arthrobacter zhaoxinii]|uniref:DUF4190 domain-containing protein n=1 Tax=Arthrobacter zhaoxinii TaxID=2964616 RepID=A0ABY5YTF1_9MICC|nr:hypothetical protein [Arthrobacter zhaoxinii]UWX96960.1 hypothetical protein N2K95_15200 [Arthrobacter zhaoxinii]